MKRVRTLVLLATVTLAVSTPAQTPQQKPEQNPADAMPTVDQIIDNYVEAIGGKPAVEKINSRVSKGTFDIPAMGAGGTAEIVGKAPGKAYSEVEIAGFGIFKRAFDGKTGWSQDPISGLRDLGPEEMEDAKIDEDFYRDIKLKELYPKLELKGKAKVGEREAYLIEAPGPAGSLDKIYFDTESGLILKMEGERASPQGRIRLETALEDYRDVEGVKVPFTLRISNPEVSFTINLTEVKHNVPVDDARFVKPAAQ